MRYHDYLAKHLDPKVYKIQAERTDTKEYDGKSLPLGYLVTVIKGDKYVGVIDEDVQSKERILGQSRLNYMLDHVKEALDGKTSRHSTK